MLYLLLRRLPSNGFHGNSVPTFFRHLLDADPASNTLSWRWVAGLQTPGKTYLVRLSNIEKYAPHYLTGNGAGSKRIADGAVVAAVVEETAEMGKQALPQYASCLPETTKRTGLWLHPDDLTPEIGPLAALAPVSIAGCISQRVYRECYHLSEPRMASRRTVLGDGLARASAHFDCPAETLETDDPVNGLCDWATQNQLSGIVAFAPMVGPGRDMLPRLSRHLEARGISLTLIRRASDTLAFSFATAGFFSFWQKMNRLLTESHTP